MTDTTYRDFSRPDSGPNIGSFSIHKWAKNSCFHSHFYKKFQEFLCGAIKATNMLQLYTDNFLWFLIQFKWQSNSFRLHQIFPIFNGPNAFFPKFNRPYFPRHFCINFPDQVIHWSKSWLLKRIQFPSLFISTDTTPSWWPSRVCLGSSFSSCL